MKGELPFSSPCVVGHEITGEVVDHGAHTPAEIINRYCKIPVPLKEDVLSRKNTC
jgi:threonine dehydrogenase-like Zn-dependent dehydrogenase